MKIFKNRFLFIMLISVVTLVLLIVGALSLYQDHSSVFSGDGYIIETTTKANKKYYFSANTKYKENVDDKISFSDQKSKKVSVDPASFVHYNNGDVAFLKKGALVNLDELTNPMVTYYNITDENIITYDKDSYVVSSNGKQINIDSFIGRINDNKYIIAGNGLSIKVPTVDERIEGDYFEILYVEEGIVRIDNKEHSYQVTAQDSYVYVGEDVTINLGDGKIFYDGTPKMLMSQITINGDENIDLDVDKSGSSGEGGGTGEGTGTETENGENTGEEITDPSNTGEEGGAGGDGSSSDDDGKSSGGIGGTGVESSAISSPQIELIDAVVTTTSLDLSLQLNNAGLAKSDIVYYLKNVSNGNIVNDVTTNKISLVNGTFKIIQENLDPSTEYVLTIGELTVADDKQYFQKTFKTKDFGVSLERLYATSSSLSYRVNFESESEVESVQVSMYDNSGSESELVNICTVAKDSLDHNCVFDKLKSNTNYSVGITNVWIHDVAYSNYNINRLDSTLKTTPTLQDIKITTNTDEVTFNIKLEKVTDPDQAIINYVYKVYKADDINLENPNPKPVYSVVKSDTSPLLLNLNEIKELKTGVDYRVNIFAQYHDNEMIREVSSGFSSNFLIKSKPNVSFKIDTTTMNSVSGVLSLIDSNCVVPMQNRICSSEKNLFTVRYYRVKDSESNAKEVTFSTFNSSLEYNLALNELASNTTYVMKVYGNYFDDEGVLHSSVQLGDTLYFTTDKSVNLHMEVIGDNTSGVNELGVDDPHTVVTFNAKLAAPTDQMEQIMNEISTITFNLYSGRYNTKEKLIGTYKMTNHNDIEAFFNNMVITNKIFTDVTDFNVGKLDSLQRLIKVTNNVSQSLNSDYTVEIEDVYDAGEVNKIKVEDNVYTFHLTNSYYLDSRIIAGGGKYIAVTPIKKEQLTEAEASKLNGLTDLNKDTVVGLIVENSLSDIYVDSAFTYEKVVVRYSVFNKVTNKEVFSYEEDMGNKYQPKVQRFFLDPSTLDDGEHFTRGYNYSVGYTLNFVTEDGSNPVYSHELLNTSVSIDRQAPIYTQFISKSTANDITYRYKFSDVDKAIYDNNFYYKLGSSTDYDKVENSLVADGKEHDVVLPINDRVKYKVAYYRKTNAGSSQAVDIASYEFEKEYNSVSTVSYRIVNDNDNTLKLRLEKNDVTDRAVAYRVNIKAKDNSVSSYSVYFLASSLSTLNIDTGNVDENGEKIYDKYQYIAVDYANISKFMKHQMEVEVIAYFDSGLVGLHQDFTDGLILKKDLEYLNVYNGDSNAASGVYEKKNAPLGVYYLRNPYNDTDKELFIYNQLRSTTSYNPFKGAGYYGENFTFTDNIGVKFKVSASNAGLIYNYVKDYSGYNAKVLKKATLVTNNNNAYFENITPTIRVTSKSTINSVNISIAASGIYGNTQFIKDGATHRKVYVNFYSDEGKTNLIKSITSDITVEGSDETGYNATIDDVAYSNLKPDTSYYFTVSAYIDGRLVQLYDKDASTSSYVAKTYVAKTLGTKGILNGIKFVVSPVGYQGESSKKRLTWLLNLKDTNNYKVRFELYVKDGDALEDGSYRYKAVKFDGNNGTSCNGTSVGNASGSYISNCYISVDKNDLATINNKDVTYDFSGDSFVFGDGYYRLVVYAIPYTDNAYNENDKVVLYENLELKTTGKWSTVNEIDQFIDVSSLEAATFSLQQESDVSDGIEREVFIKFVPLITDNSYVMKYGKYTISLLDSNGNVVEGCDAYVNGTKTATNLNPCTIELDSAVNTHVMFGGDNLVANAMYSVNFTYSNYRNNAGFTEEQKVSVTPTRSFIYSPNKYGVVLGQVTTSLLTNQSVAFTYSGSHSLGVKVKQILYTITLNGGLGNKVSGYYSVRSENSNATEIFSVSSTGNPRFVIDLTNDSVSSDTTFTFKNGNSYLIDLQYYSEDGMLIGTSNMLLSL